jgi:hypothetical protein
MSQYEDDNDDFIYQQDGVPPHYNNLVRGYFNQHLPQRWIQRKNEKTRRCFAGRQDRMI